MSVGILADLICDYSECLRTDCWCFLRTGKAMKAPPRGVSDVPGWIYMIYIDDFDNICSKILFLQLISIDANSLGFTMGIA